MERRISAYAESLKKIDVELGYAARSDDYYRDRAMKEIAAYEQSDEYKQAAQQEHSFPGSQAPGQICGLPLHVYMFFLKDDILKGGIYNSTSMVKDEDPRGDLEVYDDKRIISMTGDMLSESNELNRAGSAATVYLRQELGEARSQKSFTIDVLL